MSNKPILLFLHGVGDGDKNDNWKSALTESLAGLGYPDFATARVIAPKYAHALKDYDETVPLPGVTIKRPVRDAARQNRREFERRTGAIELRLGRHDGGNVFPGGDAVIGMAVGLPLFEQAHNYLKNPHIRANVLSLILAKLPEAGNLVIVAHSLGSVIAADLLRRLPVGLHVAGMVTIGSPLASGSFDVDKLGDALSEPPTNLAWWVNFWNAPDPVSAHRGLSSVFPWLIDFRINTKQVGTAAHAATAYLANEAVAASIGYAMFGSTSKELATVETGIDIPLDTAETLTLLALRYAHLTRMRLDGDLQDRFAGALRTVQATAIERIRERNARDGRGMPSAIALLAFDLSDPHATVPEPAPSRHLSKEDAVIPLTLLASENVIRPFEIAVPNEKFQSAMQDLTAEMGLGGQFGTDVFSAAKRAQNALSKGSGIRTLIKWGALGVGAAALAVGTGGLVLAAGAGLAGAAAITSALAAFGPGGMIGGLLTAGTLVTAGGGGIAYSLASPGTTAETLEAVVSRRLAAEILRQRQGLEADPTTWSVLVVTEMEVRREHERLDEFSDDSAPALKELKRKIDAIERALKYLRDNGLEPGVRVSTAGETS